MLIYDEPRVLDGKRKQHYETVSVKSEAQARRLLGKRLDAIEAGEFEASSKMTFGDLLDRYFDARKGRLEETTLALYRRTINQHVRPKIGNVRLDKLTREHVERILDDARDCSTRKRKGQPLCGRTKRNILIRVRSVLAWGSKNYEGVRNIARNVEPPLIEDREDVAFDGERVRKLLNAAKGTEIEAAVIAAIGTGLRRGELCALRWCEIDLDKAVLRVRQSAALLDGRIITKAPKTKGSRRDVSMPDFVVKALRQHREQQEERHRLLGIGNEGTEGVVFDRYDGLRWNPNELSRQFSRLVRRKKLPATRFHDLRHGYASLAFAAGVPLKTASELLGHSGINVTANVYTHIMDEQRRAAAKLLNHHLNKAVGSA
jgi:integrase